MTQWEEILILLEIRKHYKQYPFTADCDDGKLSNAIKKIEKILNEIDEE